MFFGELASAPARFLTCTLTSEKYNLLSAWRRLQPFALRAFAVLFSRAVYFISLTHDRYWQLQLATQQTALLFGLCCFSPWHTAAHAGCNCVVVAAMVSPLRCRTTALLRKPAMQVLTGRAWPRRRAPPDLRCINSLTQLLEYLAHA